METSEPSPAPVNIPVPEPSAEDSVDLTPPLEQPVPPASEENNQSWGEVPPPPLEKPVYEPFKPQTPPYPQGQTPRPMHEGDLQRPPTQERTASPRSAVAYRQQTLPIQPVPSFTTEAIGYPLTSRYAVTSPFGWRQHPVSGNSSFHAGVDLAAPHGTPTLAMLSGRVIHANWEGGYGNSVVIEHPGTGLKTRYAHLSRIHVQVGQWIDKGGHVGDSGATGLVTGPHAHIEIMVNGQHVDPQQYLAQSNRQAALWKRFHVWAG
ncbi:MAG: M23 family metallopeptidase [Acaryochloris sp. RU_4_1]|nr:M23 family metallopeptidase [Acaryochloris sp. RU_4_1]NJR56599.1 M23 family metallopeptidase [Acaryochloris sp. CRU_2_0]